MQKLRHLSWRYRLISRVVAEYRAFVYAEEYTNNHLWQIIYYMVFYIFQYIYIVLQQNTETADLKVVFIKNVPIICHVTGTTGILAFTI